MVFELWDCEFVFVRYFVYTYVCDIFVSVLECLSSVCKFG